MFEEIIPYIKKPARSIITAHSKPDADAFGSIIGLARLLRHFGHEVTCFVNNAQLERFKFLGSDEKILDIVSAEELDLMQYDLFWLVDAPFLKRTKLDLQIPETLKTIVIDNHENEEGWEPTVRIEDLEATSVCQLIFELFEQLNLTISPELATILLAGIATDTGFFTYYFDARTLAVASRLIVNGANYKDILFHWKRSLPIEQLKYYGEALSLIQLDETKKISYIIVNNDLWNKYSMISGGAKYDDLSEYVQMIDNTIFGLLVTEKEPGVIRSRLISRFPEKYNVAHVAEKLGGGGHDNVAAVVRENTAPETAAEEIIKVMQETIEEASR